MIKINKILVEKQFGFKKNLATEEVMYKLTFAILRDWNNKSIVGGIFCDLEKVSDSVNVIWADIPCDKWQG